MKLITVLSWAEIISYLSRRRYLGYKLRAVDVVDPRLMIHEPNFDKKIEIYFMPEQITKRLSNISQTISDLRSTSSSFCYSTV